MRVATSGEGTGGVLTSGASGTIILQRSGDQAPKATLPQQAWCLGKGKEDLLAEVKGGIIIVGITRYRGNSPRRRPSG